MKNRLPLAAMSLLLSLWLGVVAAAEPAWEQAARALRAAALPAAQAEALLAQAKTRQVPAAQVIAWAGHMAQLNRSGIPATLMAERIQQGLTKGVPAARIDQAVAALQANLLWAQQVLDRHVAKAEIRRDPAQVEEAYRNLEASLRAGIERAQVEQIFGKSPLTLEQLAAFARAAADLRTWGMEGSAVARVLARAANTGMGAGELQGLESKFAAGVAAGRSTASLFAEFEQRVAEFRPRGVRDDASREIREGIRHEQMQDFQKPPMDMPSSPPHGPTGGGGYPSY